MQFHSSLQRFKCGFCLAEDHAYTEAPPGHVPGLKQEAAACREGQRFSPSGWEDWEEMERVVRRQR